MPHKDPEKMKEVKKRYRESHRLILREKSKVYTAEYRKKNRERDLKLYYAQKGMIFDLYGWHCNCCGEENPKFLTIDHVDGDGRRHRNAGMRLYSQILRDITLMGKEKFQILCYNCNCSKRLNNNICPHKDI